LPPRRRFGSEGPQRRPGDEVSLKVERVVDGGMVRYARTVAAFVRLAMIRIMLRRLTRATHST